MAISDEQLHAVGRVTVNFAQLEFIASAFLVGLIGPKTDNGWVIVSQLSFGRIVGSIDSLMQDNCPDEALVAECVALCKRASAVEQERNRLMHSSWLVDGSGDVSRIKITASKGLRLNNLPADVSVINSVADRIRDLGNELEKFIGKCVAADATLRGLTHKDVAADGTAGRR